MDDVSFTIDAGRRWSRCSARRAAARPPRCAWSRPRGSRRAGRILIGGGDVTLLRRERARRRDGVPVLRAVPAHERAGERLLRPVSMPGGQGARARAGARRSSQMLGLAGLRAAPALRALGRPAAARRVARALVLEPEVLLFDEPLSNLDAKLRRRVREEIRELQQSLQLTVVYVTHDQEEALAVSDQIIVMDGGRIAQQGTPQELYEPPASRFIADFIGDANLVDGELVAQRRHGDCSAPPASALPVRADARRRRHGHAGAAPAPAARGRRRAGRRCSGVCKRAAYLGSHIEVLVDTPWGELLVFATPTPPRRQRARRSAWPSTRRRDRARALRRRPVADRCPPTRPARCGAACGSATRAGPWSATAPGPRPRHAACTGAAPSAARQAVSASTRAGAGRPARSSAPSGRAGSSPLRPAARSQA